MKKQQHDYLKLKANHDDINRLFSQNLYNAHSDNDEYKLLLEILKLQSIMMAKLVNPEMELEINAKCIIEEVEV